VVASTLNPNVGAWLLAPAASEIEAQTVRWIAEFIGYPVSSGGLLVSGGNMANLACFWAARAAKADWNIRTTGVAAGDGARFRLYGSAAMHTWIQKAADLSALGTDAVRWIGTNDQQQIRVDLLRDAIAKDRIAGDVPFLVVGTADPSAPARSIRSTRLRRSVASTICGFTSTAPMTAWLQVCRTHRRHCGP